MAFIERDLRQTALDVHLPQHFAGLIKKDNWTKVQIGFEKAFIRLSKVFFSEKLQKK